MSSVRPLVSCVMPTFNRRAFVPDAIECFRRQTYPNRELVIVDDGSDPVVDLVPDDPMIRYIQLDGRRSTGAKRNAACEHAAGTVIAHWDDDDWSAPDRVDVQVRALLESGADVCGLSNLYFHEPRTDRGWLYSYPARARQWVAGGTMCYRRSFWERHPFPDVRQGEDTQFVWADRSIRIVALDRLDLYVATVHPANTSAKRTSGRRWSSVPGAEIRAVRAAGSRTSIPTPASAKEEHDVMSSHQITPNHHVIVSIPHRGDGAQLRVAVDSILAQTHHELSCVVILDGDDQAAIALADVDDQRLHIHPLAANHGRYFADQVVLEATTSEYFLVQDSDDWSEPTRLARLLAELDRSGADVCVSDALHHDQRSGVDRCRQQSWPHLHDPVGAALIHRAGHQGLYRTSMLRSIGGWYAGWRIGYDTSILNLVLMAGGRLASVDEPLYHRSIRAGSLSTSPTTGWNTPERRRVVAELRRFHAEVHAATAASDDPPGAIRAAVASDDPAGTIRAMVLECVSHTDRAELGIEARRVRSLLEPAQAGRGRTPLAASTVDASGAVGSVTSSPRLPGLANVLERFGGSNPGWAISDAGAIELFHRLRLRRSARVLDVGSGFSTVVEAAAVAPCGGRVVALEHDAGHAATTRRMLESIGLADYVEVIDAPLVSRTHASGTGPWYQHELSGRFDFVVVDGPPLGMGGRIATFPAVVAHRRRDWELWLFDANRPEEQHCLDGWHRRFRFDETIEYFDPTGVAVLRPAAARTSGPVLDKLAITLLAGGRPDVLGATVASFSRRFPEQVEHSRVTALVNGPDEASRAVLDEAGWIDRILTYERGVLTIGMATSFVTARALGDDRAAYLLHLEDDWEVRSADDEAIVRGAHLLGDDHVGQVRLRHRSECCLDRHMVTRRPIEWTARDDHRRGRAHFTFNPSLVRADVADQVYPAVDERDAQERFHRLDLDVVQLEPGAFFHIGDQSRRAQLGRRR